MENELKVTEKRSLSATLVQSGNVMNQKSYTSNRTPTLGIFPSRYFPLTFLLFSSAFSAPLRWVEA